LGYRPRGLDVVAKGDKVGSITKTVRVSGSSELSIEDAIVGILGRASETIEEIRSFRVVEVEGLVEGSGIPAEYTVTLDIRFVVKESPTEHG
jgi:flavin-binding protein dodecin